MKILIEEYKDQIVDYITVEKIKKILIRRVCTLKELNEYE